MKKIITLLILFQTISTFSQGTYKINYTYTDKNNYSCTSLLLTNNKEAVFKIYDKQENGMINLPYGKVDYVGNDLLSQFFYSNENFVYYRFPIYGREMMYKDDYTNKINWSVNGDKVRKIGKFNCNEGKLKINGRSFTVWFTFDIPIKFGPLKLHGLPGLIVEVTEDNSYLKITLEDVSKVKDLKDFNLYKNYFLKQKTIISYPEYEKKIIDMETLKRIKQFAALKEMNTAQGTDYTAKFDNEITSNSYLEIPTGFISELNKLN